MININTFKCANPIAVSKSYTQKELNSILKRFCNNLYKHISVLPLQNINYDFWKFKIFKIVDDSIFLTYKKKFESQF